MVENESPVKNFHSHTDTRINIMTSHNQTPIRIGTSGPTWVTVEEAEITHCYLRFGCGEGMRV